MDFGRLQSVQPGDMTAPLWTSPLGGQPIPGLSGRVDPPGELVAYVSGGEREAKPSPPYRRARELHRVVVC
jgi:hypothetical protein